MKFVVVLLALVGLASCRTTLAGGDRAQDVTIEYTYINDQGKEVTVEVKADKLGLDFSRDDSKLTLKQAPSSAPLERPRFVQVERQQEPAAPRFVQVERQQEPAAPRFLRVLPQPAPAPAPAAPRTTTAFRFVDLDDFETPETRFVQVEAPRTQAQFVEVEIPRPVARTQFVQVEAPRPKVEHRFVQVEAPRPKVETRFVKVEVPEPDFETRFVQVQSPRQEALTHFVQAKPAAAAAPRPAFVPSAFTAQAHVPLDLSATHSRSFSPVRRHQFSSDDNSSEK
ncbi:uncharacterized protein [Palaemon carinicauda]|uniref:uncharacterized protein n=1 Tax=Palaemon carinicauda TaxID=392227 RepID=UPI0035B6A2CB